LRAVARTTKHQLDRFTVVRDDGVEHVIASESEAIQLVSGEGRAGWFNTRVGQSQEQPNINWIASQARDDKPGPVIASESEAIQLISGEGRAGWFNTRVGQSQEQPNINWIASPSFAMTELSTSLRARAKQSS
jgi:hypothetical protein